MIVTLRALYIAGSDAVILLPGHTLRRCSRRPREEATRLAPAPGGDPRVIPAPPTLGGLGALCRPRRHRLLLAPIQAPLHAVLLHRRRERHAGREQLANLRQRAHRGRRARGHSLLPQCAGLCRAVNGAAASGAVSSWPRARRA